MPVAMTPRRSHSTPEGSLTWRERFAWPTTAAMLTSTENPTVAKVLSVPSHTLDIHRQTK
jgi:hypothetical protein